MSKRRILLWLLLVALMFVVITRFTSLKSLGSTLLQGKWQWVLVAAALHFIYFVLYARLYQVGFRVVDVKSRMRDLLPLFFASVFVNAIAPSGGAAAGALFVDDANRHGQSGARAAVGTVLVLITDLATLTPFLAFGVVFLLLQHNLQFYDIIGAVIFVIFISILIGLLVLAKWKPDRLHQLLNWAQRTVDKVGGWFKHPDLLGEDWAEHNASDFTDASNAIADHPKRLNSYLHLGACAACLEPGGPLRALSCLFPASAMGHAYRGLWPGHRVLCCFRGAAGRCRCGRCHGGRLHIDGHSIGKGNYYYPDLSRLELLAAADCGLFLFASH